MTQQDQNQLMETAKTIADQFKLPENGYLQKTVEEYVKQSLHGLAHQDPVGIPMLPSFVSSMPTGKEKGTFLALDLGGTNFRVCLVKLLGNSKHTIDQIKEAVNPEIMASDMKTFISHLGDRIVSFLEIYYQSFLEQCAHDPESTPELKAGFTFSFPLHQTAVNRGTLIRWTKGYSINDAVGKDILQALQQELDSRGLRLHLTAVINDTVGTLLTRSYSKPVGCGPTIIGCIFGTGTNGAYSEPLANITKLGAEELAHVAPGKDSMVINTEWGAFDNALKVIPNCKYDKLLDANTPNPGFHMFEKRVSGMFLGELLRIIMVELHDAGLLFTTNEALEALKYPSPAHAKDGKTQNALRVPWSMNTAVPATLDGESNNNNNNNNNNNDDFTHSRKIMYEHLGFEPNQDELAALSVIACAIGKRAAYLSAVPLAGAVLHSRALERFDTIDVGADGSVIEHYPRFQEMIFEALEQTELGSKGVARITMGIAKDGSGVGAALCALEAEGCL
ncbi:uncharacterized protein SAPINGB_P003030 [Magnusiomyces paraingens]|uniref:Phosphotransferase n=1 Tax=Magnusiomyces paraingens TaxID=2606893 RepID=A0A5E8BNM1_9ASCO|nr:uncharacterized protein SAPINGB_P003030 [Saprochaete ingens]VVT51238.1 unnamed protein product [Saprochaete ingens]